MRAPERPASAAPRAARLLLALAAAVTAGGAGAAAPPAPVADVLGAHCRAREQTSTLRARFVQTKVFAALGEQERSAGVFYYRKPDSIRWEYSEPDVSWTVIRGERGWAVFPGIRQVQRFEIRGSRVDDILSIVGFGACGRAFADSFAIALAPSMGGDPVLSLEPRRAEISASFSRIELRLDAKDHLPRGVVLHETTGDEVRFEFRELRRGVTLDPSLFEFATPKGFSVVP